MKKLLLLLLCVPLLFSCYSGWTTKQISDFNRECLKLNDMGSSPLIPDYIRETLPEHLCECMITLAMEKYPNQRPTSSDWDNPLQSPYFLEITDTCERLDQYEMMERYMLKRRSKLSK